MSFYGRESYGGGYQSDSRRNSNSFNEEQGGVKRKKPRWGPRRGSRGGSRGRQNSSTRDGPNDAPLFKEPLPPSPQRSPPARYSRSGKNSFRNREPSPQPYFDMREMPDFVEPEHIGTPWHWDNYFHACKNWQEKHKLSYYRSRCTALEFENQMLFEQINSLIEENCVFAAERGIQPTMRLPDLGGKHGASSERAGQQVTDRKRKNESEKDKQDSKKKEDEGPKIPMGAKRKEELEQLYGKSSGLIHSLETSVQLNFNRNCDTHKPELWMAVPLNPESVVG